MLANPNDWNLAEINTEGQDLNDLLLQPLDTSGAPYDLSDPSVNILLDNEFWPWGQHNVWQVPNSEDLDNNTYRFWVFNNGNFRSRNYNNGDGTTDPSIDEPLIADANRSTVALYEVNLNNAYPGYVGSVKILRQYDGIQLDKPFRYSSYVSTATPLDDQGLTNHMLLNFGGGIEGTDLSAGYAIGVSGPAESDPRDPNWQTTHQAEGRILLRHIDANDATVAEMQARSGLPKDPNIPPSQGSDVEDAERYDECYSFRAYYMNLYPSNLSTLNPATP